MLAGKTLQFSTEDLDNLCDQLQTGGVEGGTAALRRMMADGLPARDLYLTVLPAVTRQLGRLWDEDRITFLNVRTAIARIEMLLRDIANTEPTIITRKKRQAIFANVPGEEHCLGVKMAADIQRSKGWDIHLITHGSYTELISEIEASPAQILGLSIGSQSSMHRLYTIVRALKLSRPDVKVLVSGSLVAIDERPIQLLGVDAHAATFEQAELLLNDLAE